MTKQSKVDSTATPVQLHKADGTGDLYPTQAANDYETVAAGQTTQVLGATGAVGDFLARVIVLTSTGTITIFDDVIVVAIIPVGAVGVFEFGLKSVSGTWNVTTAAATTCTCIGQFT